MKLYKIEDGYFFKTDQPKGTHTYAVWYDKKKKAYQAVQTTHVYKADPKRVKQLESGFLMRQKFPGVLLPSGVKNYAHTTDVNGHKITLKGSHVKEVSKKHLPKRISDEIKAHARGRYTVKKEKLPQKKQEPKE